MSLRLSPKSARCPCPNGIDEASVFVPPDERWRATEQSHCVRSAWSGSTAEARRAGT
jgi:hypothetical protein